MPAEKEEKTEPATPRRQTEARNRGQIARSQDLSAAVMLLAGLIGLKLFGMSMWLRLIAITQTALTGAERGSQDELVPWVNSVFYEVFWKVLPLLLVLMVGGLGILYAQVGWLLTLDPMKPSLDKLNPLNGIKRIFSLRSAMTASLNMLKVLIVGSVAYFTVVGAAPEIIYAFTLGLGDVFLLGAELVWRLGIRLLIVLLILAIMDYAYQRYQHERDMRMTKQEVKDEMKSMEGDPVVKRRRRELQLKLAAQRLRQDVPKADVVVTNPTHLAIAIQYDPDTMIAPKVVAKGADHLALSIRRIAQEHGVPIVERKALARVMYDVVEVGKHIPERFYQAIAEILAYVYELSGRSKIAASDLAGAR